MLIGDKIRSLRKNKNITQTQLAEVLSVSAQSVSKWENHISVPDISVLPVIARYFGITMDDLFSYRLDALTYKERFIRFMVDNGMLRFEDRPLSNGRVSPYYIHSGYHRMGSQISRLGEFYAECIREHGIEFWIQVARGDIFFLSCFSPLRMVLAVGLSYVAFFMFRYVHLGFLGGSVVKNLPANAGDIGSILGQEDPLEWEIITWSSIA